MNAFLKWFQQPAEWYEFWMPQSGPIGGLIFGAILSPPLAWLAVQCS